MDKNGMYESWEDIIEHKTKSKYDAYKEGILTGILITLVFGLILLRIISP